MLVLNRTACLGGDVTQLKIGTNHDFNNQQKIRADMFIDIINGKTLKPNSNIIISYLLEPQYFSGVYSQSEELRWLSINGKPEMLFIDNYSELVDKKFIHKDGWAFCGEYGNFKYDPFLDGTFIDNGLLSADLIYDSYNNLFNFIKHKWNIPIIFMHFPTTFEKREIYIRQGEMITSVLNELKLIYNIQDIHADINSIENVDINPYHFSKKTITNMANKISL